MPKMRRVEVEDVRIKEREKRRGVWKNSHPLWCCSSQSCLCSMRKREGR
jgi:hypothetical protein